VEDPLFEPWSVEVPGSAPGRAPDGERVEPGAGGVEPEAGKAEPEGGAGPPRAARWRMPEQARRLAEPTRRVPEPLSRVLRPLPRVPESFSGGQPQDRRPPQDGRGAREGRAPQDGRGAREGRAPQEGRGAREGRAAQEGRGAREGRAAQEGRAAIDVAGPPRGLAGADRIRELLAVRAREAAATLREAGHRAEFDDRTEDPGPSVRLHLAPWRAPFDEPGGRRGSALEIGWVGAEGDGAGEVIVRMWLDGLATTPTREIRVEAAKADDAFVRSVLLDFVGAVLART